MKRLLAKSYFACSLDIAFCMPCSEFQDAENSGHQLIINFRLIKKMIPYVSDLEIGMFRSITFWEVRKNSLKKSFFRLQSINSFCSILCSPVLQK